MVDFSNVSGSETPNNAEISVPRNSTVVVRLSASGGYRGLLVGGFSGLVEVGDAPQYSLSSDDVMKLVETPPAMPNGILATQATPFHRRA